MPAAASTGWIGQVSDDRIPIDQFKQQVWDRLRDAVKNDELTADELKALLAILEPIAERKKQGGLQGSVIEPHCCR